jgi:serine/threonine protein kinase
VILPRLRDGGPASRDAERYAAWQAALDRLRADADAGRLPAPADLAARLRDLPEDQRDGAARDLVAAHLRLAGGRLENYSALVPEPDADLVVEEILARREDPPSLDELDRRFPHAPLRDRLAAARFLRLRRLGAGAAAWVWEALDSSERRFVALKELRPGAPPDAPARLAREARGLARFDHPALPRLLAPHSGGSLLVLSLVRGATLAERASGRRRAAPLAPLLDAFLSACDGVAHAHARGVVHGDLKPGNVLVGEDGAVVIDWGLARLDGEESPAGLGTPESMAPEQADGAADERSDVFGLGAVLYEVLYGEGPRRWPPGVRPADWRARVRAGEVSRPSPGAPRVPGVLAAICARALAFDPRGRFAGVRELAEEVRGALAAAHAQPLMRRFWRRIVGVTGTNGTAAGIEARPTTRRTAANGDERR